MRLLPWLKGDVRFPRVVRKLQILAHKGFAKVFQNPAPFKPPWQLKWVLGIRGANTVLGYIIGIGVRPEHAEIERPCLTHSAQGRAHPARSYTSSTRSG